ncbi:FGGY-family carbohydrate kinase [Clostridium sp. C105KSO13]|uniref:FGGY-family carbohydrate kinase n=1 Tax=Clostridium sp. C105KSO13 TaxID=1776045 RepID=UPI0007407DC2|nr:FGGY-family carbohydrate kinase [Clostridium sp. C105KSO13]CUX29673.1 L-xylulose/3-keto-L-gulonate kinase [Clostridium sp. C105KSO13]
MAKYVIGLDNGGTTTKAAIFNLDGVQISSAGMKTRAITPKPGYVERDMEELWQANCKCVKDALKKSSINPKDVIGIAVCGHGKGIYLWGKNDRPIYNGIISTDSRAWRYPKKWYDSGVHAKLHGQLCQEFMACQQVALLAWFKDNQREIYDNIKYVFSVKDYVRFRLTREAYSEATDISGSGLMDVRSAQFDKTILEELGIQETYDTLPPLRYSCDLCGKVTKEAAKLTGLPEGIPVAGGMFDVDACAVAVDVTSTEELCTIAGTWSINEYIAKAPVMDGSIAMNSLFAIPGYYLVEESSATSAGNLEWFLKNFMVYEKLEEGQEIYDVINKKVGSVSPEDSDVYFLPFLYGSNAHPLGKGAFVGLTAYHGMEHILRAIYEGVAFSHKTHIDKLLASRKPPQAIRMAGGAVNSPVWVQMFADVIGYPMETVDTKELGALGCGMAAAIAAGVYKNYQEAAAHMVHVARKVYPSPERINIYRKKYEKYMAVSQALDTVWWQFEV